MTYEEFLDQNKVMTYTFKGVSMLPLLRSGKDMFTVEKKEDKRCKKGDVVLYRRPPAQYVLHRIIKVRDRDYVILGDNCIGRELVSDKDIIGVMTSYIRDGKEHSVKELPYRIYSWVWVNFAPVRVTYKKLRGKAGALLRKLK